jgi:Domain of unknown function (DUF4922)
MRCSLAADAERLIESQVRSWPLLAQGIQGLRESRTRALRIGRYEVLVCHIPHRIKGTTAAVDEASITKRPCFLCSENLPREEQGIAMDEEFTAYCNPFPILEKHLTIVHREHRPQAITGFVMKSLGLAKSLPGYFLIYNGPRCGASAPDHLHFQACSREIFPIERDTRDLEGPAVPDCGRSVFLLRDGDAERLNDRVERLIEILADVTGTSSEPMINIALQHDSDRWTVFVFPRAKHRPRVFATGELTVSPAAIDLSGIFVVPLADDFERITAADVRSIFEEVTLAPSLYLTALRRMAPAG